MTVERVACRRYLWLIVTALATAMLLASGCMWGFVTDSDTGAAVSGATVKYTDSKGVTRSTTTDANGLYAFDQAKGKSPAAGPITVEVSATGYSSLTAPRLVEYNDNANASLADLSSFWEIQSFTLMPITTPSVTADLAVTDLYPDTQPTGTLWARITNHGPDSLTNAAVQLTCESKRTDKATCGKTTLGPVIVPLTLSLNPGQTQAFDTAIGLDTANYWYDANCTVQVSFDDPNTTNNLYSEIIPPPAGDLELEDILLKTTNEVGFKLSASGSLPSTFWYTVMDRYPNGSGSSFSTSALVVVGSSAYWTMQTIGDTPSVEVWIDNADCFPETNEANNKMTKTCSAASHTCW